MDQTQFLIFTTAIFERLGITYAITGSHASIAYGETRFTNDVDVVARISPSQVNAFVAAFDPQDFYVSDMAAMYAAENGGMFNVIQPETGHKLDVIIPAPTDRPDQLNRRRQVPVQPGYDLWFVAPEDLILKKMAFYKEGGSEKHLRDIASMLRISGEEIDMGYIDRWAGEMGVGEIWRQIVERVRSSGM